jgi:hypothetical protein
MWEYKHYFKTTGKKRDKVLILYNLKTVPTLYIEVKAGLRGTNTLEIFKHPIFNLNEVSRELPDKVELKKKVKELNICSVNERRYYG